MAVLNCWEFKKCERIPGGAKAAELGICPAAVESHTTGMNRGLNGGRACWAIAGTLCDGVVQGTFASKISSCLKCKFYQLVNEEEGVNHQSVGDILAKLR